MNIIPNKVFKLISYKHEPYGDHDKGKRIRVTIQFTDIDEQSKDLKDMENIYTITSRDLVNCIPAPLTSGMKIFFYGNGLYLYGYHQFPHIQEHHEVDIDKKVIEYFRDT